MPTTAPAVKPASSSTAAQVASYDADGYAVARGLLSSDEVAHLNDAFLRQAARGPVAGMFDGDPASTAADPLARLPRMMHPHRQPQLEVGALAMRYLLDRRVHTVLAALLRDEPIATQTMYYFKPPGARGQALHQDNYYLAVRPLSCIAAWIALDDCDEENGGLSVVPGSHRLPVACPELADRTQSFSDDLVRPPAGMEPVPVPLRAGDALFFHGSVIHGSGPNRCRERMRRSFISHYMPASASQCSRWYAPLHAFDGTEVARDLVDNGGFCGSTVTAPH